MFFFLALKSASHIVYSLFLIVYNENDICLEFASKLTHLFNSRHSHSNVATHDIVLNDEFCLSNLINIQLNSLQFFETKIPSDSKKNQIKSN